MHENTTKTLLRDCAATRIPSGEAITLPKDSPVYITQALGGSYTVSTNQGLARIADADAEALGLEPTAPPPAAAVGDHTGPVEEKAVWDQLRTCYDPEIPVNIVDLGLVYDCIITPRDGHGAMVEVKMTLTAPGCGMGPTIAADAKGKILALEGIDEAEVELVWDPPWNQSMITEAGKMKLGIL